MYRIFMQINIQGHANIKIFYNENKQVDMTAYTGKYIQYYI